MTHGGTCKCTCQYLPVIIRLRGHTMEKKEEAKFHHSPSIAMVVSFFHIFACINYDIHIERLFAVKYMYSFENQAIDHVVILLKILHL